MNGHDAHDGSLSRSDVERLVTIETMLRDVISRLTSLNVDLNADSNLLDQLRTEVTRLSFELGAEKQARVDLNGRIALLDADMRASMAEMRKAIDRNSGFRRDVVVGAGAGAAVVTFLAGVGIWLLGWGPAIAQWLQGGG